MVSEEAVLQAQCPGRRSPVTVTGQEQNQMKEAQLGPGLQGLVGIEAGFRAQGRARPQTCLHLHQVPAEVRI